MLSKISLLIGIRKESKKAIFLSIPGASCSLSFSHYLQNHPLPLCVPLVATGLHVLSVLVLPTRFTHILRVRAEEVYLLGLNFQGLIPCGMTAYRWGSFSWRLVVGHSNKRTKRSNFKSCNKINFVDGSYNYEHMPLDIRDRASTVSRLTKQQVSS